MAGLAPTGEAETRARYDPDALHEWISDVVAHYGVARDEAALAADVLIYADLAGIESHGIAHMPWHPGYAPGFERGIVNPTPAITVLRESPVSAAWDGDGGMGVIVCHQAMTAAIEKAEQSGVGMISVANGRHFGAAGYFVQMAAERDLIGMAFCNVPPIAVAAGGLDRVFGTNPIAMAAPVADDHPFVLDIATTVVAGGKLEIAQRQGHRLPPGWAVDEDGADSDDPEALRTGGALLPLGSRLETSSHKGFGLGLMVDILSGVLGGAGSGLFLDRRTLVQGQFLAAWRIDLFRDPGEFKAEMKRMVDAIRATRPAPGVAAVLVPGDPEAIACADRQALGIPLDAASIEQLTALGEKVATPFPAPSGVAR